MDRFIAAVGLLFLMVPGNANAEVGLEGVRFLPPETTVRAGDTVRWVHRDSGLFHHVAADDGSFDSHPTCGRPAGVCMRGGETYSHTFLSPGVYRYHCRLHSSGRDGMVGTITVVER